jgi:hypothetical protein
MKRTREIRRMAVGLATAAAAMRVLLWQHGAEWLVVPIAVCGLGALVGVLHPAALVPLHFMLRTVGDQTRGFLVRVGLRATYYLVLTPIALAARVARKRFLLLGPDESRGSYWRPRERTGRGEGEYGRPF